MQDTNSSNTVADKAAVGTTVTPAKRKNTSGLVRNLDNFNRSDARHAKDDAVVWNEDNLNRSTKKRVIVTALEHVTEPNEITEVVVTLPTLKECIPSPERSIVENKGLSELICNNVVCRVCKRVKSLELSFPSIGVTTIPRLCCTRCGWTFDAEVSKSCIRGDEAKRDALVDYDTNVKFGLAFIASGDGGVEAQRFLALMSLPNATTFEKSSMPKIEKGMTESIQALTDQYLQDNLVAEVMLTCEGDMTFDFDQWKTCLEEGGHSDDADIIRPQIGVSMDMGWNKRSSGRKYDSNSGSAFLVGVKTRKPVARCLKSLFCRTCVYHINKNKQAPVHECQVNHKGSSGSMEADALIEMTESLHYNRLTSLNHVITDDDSKMKAICKWSNDDWLRHYGKTNLILRYKKSTNPEKPRDVPVYRKGGSLKYPVHEPVFLADPAHRKKTFKNRLYKLKKLGVTKGHGILDGDILRLQLYFIYYVRQMHLLPEDEREKRAWCVLDHHFDDHENCGEWCKRKMETDEEKLISGKAYRDKVTHASLYEALHEIIAPFIKLSSLLELSHGSDTNVNESLNQTISWFAPKNKTYCGSNSLRNRVGMAISIHIVGYDNFFVALFGKLGLTVDACALYCLQRKQIQRMRHLDKRKTPEYKKRRHESTFIKLKTYYSTISADKNLGKAYQTGSAMEEGDELPAGSTIVRCKRCHCVGHKTANSKQCLFHRSRRVVSSTESTALPIAKCATVTTNEIDTLVDDVSGESSDSDLETPARNAVSMQEDFSLIDSISISTDCDITTLTEDLEEEISDIG